MYEAHKKLHTLQTAPPSPPRETGRDEAPVQKKQEQENT